MNRKETVFEFASRALDELDGEDIEELLDGAIGHLFKALRQSDCDDYENLCPMCDGQLYLAVIMAAAAEALAGYQKKHVINYVPQSPPSERLN